MRTLYVIGIGAGHPDQVTLQAVAAIGRVDTFFVIGKGEEKRELLDLRATILDRHAGAGHRVVEVQDPPRDRDPGDYRGAVEDWHRRRAALLAAEFAAVDGVGGILVWGDPALYDSTLRLVETIRGTQDFEYTVIPGITSPQALAAAHRTVLHGIGQPVHITTGRRLRAEGLGNDPTLVMLDGDCAWTTVPPDDVHIWWGAYLGMPDEELIEGPLAEVGPRIVARRAELRAAKGWIMDIYLLRRATEVPPLVIALPTEDRRRAVAFYRDALGLEPFGDLAGDGVPEPLQYRLDARTTLMLVPTGGFGWVLGDRSVATPGTSECLLGLALRTEAEVIAATDRACAAGATVITAPATQPWGFTATFADPDGHVWQLTVPS